VDSSHGRKDAHTRSGQMDPDIDKVDLFSPVDDGHLNKQGQAAEAKQIWPVVEKLLGG
jgi:hypothetical protein